MRADQPRACSCNNIFTDGRGTAGHYTRHTDDHSPHELRRSRLAKPTLRRAGLDSPRAAKQVIEIDQLWSIRFGNGGANGLSNQLFFTAGSNEYADGLLGVITIPQ